MPQIPYEIFRAIEAAEKEINQKEKQGATYRSIKAVLEYRLTMAIDTLMAQGRIDREQFGLIDRFTEVTK